MNGSQWPFLFIFLLLEGHQLSIMIWFSFSETVSRVSLCLLRLIVCGLVINLLFSKLWSDNLFISSSSISTSELGSWKMTIFLDFEVSIILSIGFKLYLEGLLIFWDIEHESLRFGVCSFPTDLHLTEIHSNWKIFS